MALTRDQVPSYAGKGLNPPVSWFLESTPTYNSSGDIIGYRNDNWDSSTGSFKSSSGASSASSVVSQPALSGVSLSLPSTGSMSMSDLYKQLQQIQAQNNAWSAEQAQKQMDFQAAQADKASAFNADQADLSREWTEYMSSTAHQREVKDLQAAGLNPVLSVMGGNGAPVTSGAVAAGYTPGSGAKGDTDTSLTHGLVSLLGSVIQAQTSMANMAMSARTQESVADKYTSMSELVANIQRDTSLSVANINSMASRYSAEVHADSSKVAAAISAAAHRYGYDVMAMSNKEIAAFNAEVNRELKDADIQARFDLAEQYPTSMYGALSSALGSLTGSSGLSGAVSSAKDIASKLASGIKSLFYDEDGNRLR